MWELHQCLAINHDFCHSFSQAHEILREARDRARSDDIFAHLHLSSKVDQQCYNLPTSDEISIILLAKGARANSS